MMAKHAILECHPPPRCRLGTGLREPDQKEVVVLMTHSKSENNKISTMITPPVLEYSTCKMVIVSTASTPPILLISAPHRSMTPAISALCAAPPPSTILIRPTIAAITASRTRVKATLLAIRSVLSSTAALSTECPSANARSRDCFTSFRNSDSARVAEDGTVIVGVPRGRDITEDATEPERERRPSPSDSLSSSEEVTDPASE